MLVSCEPGIISVSRNLDDVDRVVLVLLGKMVWGGGGGELVFRPS